MQRIFLPPEQFSGDTAQILGPDHLHLARVLRARSGDSILLLDRSGNAFHAVLVTLDKDRTIARITGPAVVSPEPPISITVAQALGKGDRFEQVVQHGTEAGASVFVPLRTERCMVDIPAARVADRVARWNQIAKSAAEQSGRTRIPGVQTPQTASALFRPQQTEALALLLHPDPEAKSLRTALEAELTPPVSVVIAVGPEGGWSPVEVTAAQRAGFRPVSLGPYTLRTETAALIAISRILYHFER